VNHRGRQPMMSDRHDRMQVMRARTQFPAKGGQQWVHRSIIVGSP
jgi:hypothetical protein